MVKLSKTVTESLTQDELDAIRDEVAATYGVEADNVVLDAVYQATGSMSLDIFDPVSESDLAQTLESEIASLLGISDDNVEVVIEDGVATYTITSADVESAENLQDVLVQPETLNALDSVIGQTYPVDILSVDTEDDIATEIILTLDTDNAENDLDIASQIVENIFRMQGFTTNAESNIKYTWREKVCTKCLLYTLTEIIQTLHFWLKNAFYPFLNKSEIS